MTLESWSENRLSTKFSIVLGFASEGERQEGEEIRRRHENDQVRNTSAGEEMTMQLYRCVRGYAGCGVAT